MKLFPFKNSKLKSLQLKKPKLKNYNHFGDKVFYFFLKALALLFIFLFLSMAVVIFIKSWPAFKHFGPAFFVNPTWDSWKQNFGALALIYGTLLSSILALILAVPISIAFALFLNEMAPRWLARSLGFVVEMLAAIPSIIYGMWGLFVLAPFLREKLQPFLSEKLGFFPAVFRLLLWDRNDVCGNHFGYNDYSHDFFSLS